MESKYRRSDLLDSKPLIYFFVQTAFGTSFTYLTSGVFLSGLALLMGAGDTLVSYLSIVVNICGVLTLLFSGLMERFQSRKRVTIGLTVLSRLATLCIVAIPAIIPKETQLIVLVPLVLIAFTLQAQTTVVLNQWMLTFMDERKSGGYISLRQTLTLGVTVVLSVTSGYWMDHVGGRYIGFVILFAIATLMGLFEILLLAKTPDSAPYWTVSRGGGFRAIMSLPLKNRRYTGFVLYILAFYLLLYVSDSFTMLYMMKYLALPYQTVTMLYMIMSLPQIILLGIWGRISDKKGHQFVLRTSIWLFAGETLFMAFSTQQTWFVFIPLAFFVASIANAGFVISVFNARYELMPKENRIVYDNFYSAAIGVGFILGPMLGGMIKRSLESNSIVMNAMPFANIRILYLISTIGILALQIGLAYKRTKEKSKPRTDSLSCECPCGQGCIM